MTLQVSCKAGQLQVTGEMTVYHAVVLHRELLSNINEHAAVRALNLSGVTEFDTAGLQVLLFARRHALALGRPLEVVAVSPAVGDALELLHLGALAADSSSSVTGVP